MSDAAKIEEYRQAVMTAALCRQLLAQHDLPVLLRAIESADAFGPILDPTFYREKAGAMEEDRRMLEAALRFVNAEVRRG